MADIYEIADDVFRISIYVPGFDLQFNQFLIRDDEPLLYHTGMRSQFAEVHEAVGKLIEPEQLRWVGFSHFEPDECGSLNMWLAAAPHAQAITSEVGAMVFVGDYAERAPLALADNATHRIGSHNLRFKHTPHLPHGWDAGMLFDDTARVLFCSDLLHQIGAVEPVIQTGVIDRFADTLNSYQSGVLANYMPFTHLTEQYLHDLADLQPAACAAMHGSTYIGDCAAALRDTGRIMREVLGS